MREIDRHTRNLFSRWFLAKWPVSVVMIGIALFRFSTAAASDKMQGKSHSPQEVLVVSNANSPISTAIASFYSSQRGVTNKVAVHCADSAVSTANETISLADYKAQIADPIALYLKTHPDINFIVLTKGIPILIDGGITGSRDMNVPGNLHPSVDSYLAAIDYPEIKSAAKISITGSGATGYTWLNRYWKADVPFSHAAFGGYLVTRLDGYTESDAMALVTRAIAAESPTARKQSGKILLDVQPLLKLADIDSQPLTLSGTITDESDWGTWNADVVKAGRILQARKIPVELDMTETFVGNRQDLLGYFSWGSNDPKFTDAAYQSLRFAPGAIGDTAVSTSARTFLPTTGGQSLIADLIAHGITGVKGYAYEPLLQAIASPSVTLDRYTSGYTLAESFYAGSRFVGWTDIVIGDPLCRPAAWRTSTKIK